MAKIKDAKKANFVLKKFKIKDGKVVTDYNYLHDENPDAEIREYKGVKIPLQPHPDLVSLYNQLREYVLKEFYIDPSAENIMQVEVTSVSIENRLCVISTEFDTLHGKKVPLQTSKINLDDNESGLEDEIDVVLDSIIDEVFSYLFKGKRADPTLFQDSEKAPEKVGGLNVDESHLKAV
jgi:hypothetical protein